MSVTIPADQHERGVSMKKHTHFVYDDRVIVADDIAKIVGSRAYGSIVRNRRSLSDWAIDAAKNSGLESITILRDATDLAALRGRLTAGSHQACYVHFRSNGAIVDPSAMTLLFKKIELADGILFDSRVNPLVCGFHDQAAYGAYLSMLGDGVDITSTDFEPAAQIILPDSVLIDLSDVSSFLSFFSSGFEARYYNQVEGGELSVVKRSSDKTKIEREYRFYGMLPEAMRHWFVQPYNFEDDGQVASYEMERLGVADMALIWIHGAISPAEFERFVDKIMSFIAQRPSRSIPKEEYQAISRRLYIDKVRQRLEDLKSEELFSKLDTYIAMRSNFSGIESLVAEYEAIFDRDMRRHTGEKSISVIGHGDLCFSNILYDKSTRIMKFIDPRGARNEAEMWTDASYDVAKLSHSIFGGYDFINNNLFTIEIDDCLRPNMAIDSPDLSDLKTIFQRSLEAGGYDVYGIRLREASLFLSMLPLHKDDPAKVLGFLLNAADIIEELKRND